MGIVEALAMVTIVIALVVGVFRILFPPKQNSPRYAEADALLRELHVIDGLLNVLPSEFRNKLDNYLGGK